MTSTAKLHLLIDQLVEHEEVMAAFYFTLADTVPEYETLWLRLHKEEKEHVQLIRALQLEIPEGVAFDDDRVSIGVVRAAIEYAHSMQAHLKRYTPTPNRAVAMALDLEESLIERRLFELFHGETPELQRLISRLEETFRHHIEELHDIAASKRTI